MVIFCFFNSKNTIGFNTIYPVRLEYVASHKLSLNGVGILLIFSIL